MSRTGANSMRDLFRDPRVIPSQISMYHNERIRLLYSLVDEKDRFQKVDLYANLDLADCGKQVPFYVRSVHAAVCRIITRYRKEDFDLVLERPRRDGYHLYNREIASGDRTQRMKDWVKERIFVPRMSPTS